MPQTRKVKQECPPTASYVITYQHPLLLSSLPTGLTSGSCFLVHVFFLFFVIVSYLLICCVCFVRILGETAVSDGQRIFVSY